MLTGRQSRLSIILRYGTINNSVNLPNIQLDQVQVVRVTIIHDNVPKMVSMFSTIIAAEGININQLYNKSKGEVAYTVLDLSRVPGLEVIRPLAALPSIYNVRFIRAN